MIIPFEVSEEYHLVLYLNGTYATTIIMLSLESCRDWLKDQEVKGTTGVRVVLNKVITLDEWCSRDLRV